jgi:hypothetical protein
VGVVEKEGMMNNQVSGQPEELLIVFSERV